MSQSAGLLSDTTTPLLQCRPRRPERSDAVEREPPHELWIGAKPSRNARRRAAFAVTVWMVLGTLLIASPARAGSIFDDNWTPPKAAKPVEPPPDAAPSTPAKPPETSKPDTQAAPPAVVTPTPTVVAPPARRARFRPPPIKPNRASCSRRFSPLN